MVEFLSKFWFTATIGILLGVVSVFWIRPTTSEGTVLLIAICFFLSIFLGQVCSVFFKKNS